MKLLKIFGIIAAAAAGAFALVAAWAWHSTFSPEEYPVAQVQELCGRSFAVEGFELTASDALVHAWKPDKWMDSRTYCVMKTSPERVSAFKKALMALDGRVSAGNRTAVVHTAADCKGDEFACPRHGPMPGDKLPSWWPGDRMRETEWFSVGESGGHARGVDYVISEPEGLVFAHMWRT